MIDQYPVKSTVGKIVGGILLIIAILTIWFCKGFVYRQFWLGTHSLDPYVGMAVAFEDMNRFKRIDTERDIRIGTSVLSLGPGWQILHHLIPTRYDVFQLVLEGKLDFNNEGGDVALLVSTITTSQSLWNDFKEHFTVAYKKPWIDQNYLQHKGINYLSIKIDDGSYLQTICLRESKGMYCFFVLSCKKDRQNAVETLAAVFDDLIEHWE